MKLSKSILLVAFVFLFAATATLRSATPSISVSPARLLVGNIVKMKGKGFTPKATIHSHLRRPDGTEFPLLAMLTDANGEISHEIETFILGPGVFELWIDDDTAKKTTEHVRFEATLTPVE